MIKYALTRSDQTHLITGDPKVQAVDSAKAQPETASHRDPENRRALRLGSRRGQLAKMYCRRILENPESVCESCGEYCFIIVTTFYYFFTTFCKY